MLGYSEKRVVREEGGPHHTMHLPARRPWTSQPPEPGEINVVYKAPNYAILLYQLEWTKVGIISICNLKFPSAL